MSHSSLIQAMLCFVGCLYDEQPPNVVTLLL